MVANSGVPPGYTVLLLNITELVSSRILFILGILLWANAFADDVALYRDSIISDLKIFYSGQITGN